jgi:hypothetical protein
MVILPPDLLNYSGADKNVNHKVAVAYKKKSGASIYILII